MRWHINSLPANWDNPAALMTSITEAQASLELLIQLRNKAVESYNELMRLSV